MFSLQAPFQPSGDQPQAIAALIQNIEAGQKMQALKGVAGSGKTFTMANVIAHCNRPTLVMSHNKTLAAASYLVIRRDTIVVFPQKSRGCSAVPSFSPLAFSPAI